MKALPETFHVAALRAHDIDVEISRLRLMRELVLHCLALFIVPAGWQAH